MVHVCWWFSFFLLLFLLSGLFFFWGFCFFFLGGKAVAEEPKEDARARSGLIGYEFAFARELELALLKNVWLILAKTASCRLTCLISPFHWIFVRWQLFLGNSLVYWMHA